MMSIEEFKTQLIAEFDNVNPESITPSTTFKEIPNWSSMYALIIIAFVDFHFNITLNGEDLKSAETIQELYDLVKRKSV